MKKTVYMTDEARISAIKEIEKLIYKLGSCTEDFTYQDYRSVINYLAEYKKLIQDDIKS